MLKNVAKRRSVRHSLTYVNFVETILTVVETCHRQSRNSFEYLTAAVEAHFAGQSAPSLLAGV